MGMVTMALPMSRSLLLLCMLICRYVYFFIHIWKCLHFIQCSFCVYVYVCVYIYNYIYIYIQLGKKPLFLSCLGGMFAMFVLSPALISGSGQTLSCPWGCQYCSCLLHFCFCVHLSGRICHHLWVSDGVLYLGYHVCIFFLSVWYDCGHVFTCVRFGLSFRYCRQVWLLYQLFPNM